MRGCTVRREKSSGSTAKPEGAQLCWHAGLACSWKQIQVNLRVSVANSGSHISHWLHSSVRRWRGVKWGAGQDDPSLTIFQLGTVRFTWLSAERKGAKVLHCFFFFVSFFNFTAACEWWFTVLDFQRWKRCWRSQTHSFPHQNEEDSLPFQLHD